VTLLDEALPRWDEHERHGVRASASAELLLEAVRKVTPADAPLLRALFALRVLRASACEPIWKQLLRGGFQVLGEEAAVRWSPVRSAVRGSS
jgi:hypothetical protein